jgi:hypothetical protein
MITVADFANYFNEQHTDCIIDTRGIMPSPSAVVFPDKYPDVMLKADFLENGEILYTVMYLCDTSMNPDFTETTRRLNLLNTVTPLANVVYIDGRLVQQHLIDATVTTLEELYDIADYNMYMLDNAARIVFSDDETLKEMLDAARQSELDGEDMYE